MSPYTDLVDVDAEVASRLEAVERRQRAGEAIVTALVATVGIVALVVGRRRRRRRRQTPVDVDEWNNTRRRR